MPDPSEQRREQMFPRLTPSQLDRIGRHGTRRRVHKGEIIVEQGDHAIPFYAIIEGTIEIVRPHDDTEDLVVMHEPGQFTGETSLLAGRRSLVRMRAGTDGEVLVLEPEAVRTLVQTDAELSELIMRAFILRRVSLIARGWGDVILIGSHHSPATLRLRQFLTRNGRPHVYLDLDTDKDVQATLDRFGVAVDDIPVLICRGSLVLKNPTFQQAAEWLGLNAEIDVAAVPDLLVVGGGPAGLAAAVYGASEGLDVLVLEKHAPGGQAGSSSRIENYLGFPTGISGQALAGRAFTQAEKFGADIAIANGAAKLRCEKRPFAVELTSGDVVRARAIVIASGARYRKPPLAKLASFEGAGIYYAATSMEAQMCSSEEIIVVGGGNSAGQAAVYLAETAKHVHILVRADGLAASMSRYLIRRIEQNPRITLRTRTEIVALEGDGHLEQVRWRNSATGEVETHLAPSHLHDDRRRAQHLMARRLHHARREDFVKTGSDLQADELAAAQWPLQRAPFSSRRACPASSRLATCGRAT
jgi:thioredoxin reductase (NADPH)